MRPAWRELLRIVLTAGTALVLLPGISHAGPVTFVLDVTMDQSCTLGENPICTALSETFQLTIDFTDPPAEDSFIGSGLWTAMSTWFPAQFSDVPLETLPNPFSGVLTGDDSRAVAFNQESMQGWATSYGSMMKIQQETTPLQYWSTAFYLQSSKTEFGPQDLIVTPPTLADLRSWMGGDLGVVDFSLFTMVATLPQCEDCPTTYDPGSRYYHGTAQLQPVPEPGLIALVGFGLAGLASRRRTS